MSDLVAPKELAEWLGVPLATVYRWNHEGTGPAPIKVGRHVRYRRSDVEDWLTANAKATHDDAA